MPIVAATARTGFRLEKGKGFDLTILNLSLNMYCISKSLIRKLYLLFGASSSLDQSLTCEVDLSSCSLECAICVVNVCRARIGCGTDGRARLYEKITEFQ